MSGVTVTSQDGRKHSYDADSFVVGADGLLYVTKNSSTVAIYREWSYVSK